MINIKPIISKKPRHNCFKFYDYKTKQTVLCSGLQIDYYDSISGKRRRHTERIPYEKVVELCERMRQNQYQGIDSIANQLAKIKVESLSILFNKYARCKTRKPITEETLIRARTAMKTLSIFTNDMPPGRIDSDVVNKYLDNELKRGLQAGGVNTNLRHLKAIFNWATKNELIKVNPFKEINPQPTEEKRIRVLSESELKQFLSVIDDDLYKALIWCYILTGARRSELLAPKLSWNDIDLEQGVMFILVKGGKRRKVTLAKTLIEMLKNIKTTYPESNYPFDIDGSAVFRKIRKYYNAAEVPIRKPGYGNLNVHSLRKTYATMQAKNGVNVYILKDLMRHSRISVTEDYYLNIADESHKQILNDLMEDISS